MNAEKLFYNIAQLVTPVGRGAKRGVAMGELSILENAAMAVSSGNLVWVGKENDWQGHADEAHDLKGQTVTPGLVDPHTHAVWAGDRLNDFEARTSGISYEEILREGGGIRSTVKHTQGAKLEQLVTLALPRLKSLIQSGATTIEVKSGYGFTPQAELKMLETIPELQKYVPAKLIPTLLIHIPPQEKSERQGYLEQICHELIPNVAKRSLAKAVDVFTEKESFTVAETEQIFRAAKLAHLPVKAHTDQFHAIGGTELTCAHRGLSVDHLEAVSINGIKTLFKSETIATLLPGVSLHLGLPAAPGRKLIDTGAAVAVGTDLNPGSSPLYSQQLALALSVRLNGLTPAEALTACTLNAASALGLENCGRLESGCRADFLTLQSSWLELAYALGANPVGGVWIGGEHHG